VARESSGHQLDEVVRFNPAIRFVILADNEGGILDAVKRAGVDSRETTNETRTITERYGAMFGLADQPDNYFGSAHFFIIRRDKLVELMFPVAGKIIIVAAHPSFHLEKVDGLEKLIRSIM